MSVLLSIDPAVNFLTNVHSNVLVPTPQPGKRISKVRLSWVEAVAHLDFSPTIVDLRFFEVWGMCVTERPTFLTESRFLTPRT